MIHGDGLRSSKPMYEAFVLLTGVRGKRAGHDDPMSLMAASASGSVSGGLFSPS